MIFHLSIREQKRLYISSFLKKINTAILRLMFLKPALKINSLTRKREYEITNFIRHTRS